METKSNEDEKIDIRLQLYKFDTILSNMGTQLTDMTHNEFKNSAKINTLEMQHTQASMRISKLHDNLEKIQQEIQEMKENMELVREWMKKNQR